MKHFLWLRFVGFFPNQVPWLESEGGGSCSCSFSSRSCSCRVPAPVLVLVLVLLLFRFFFWFLFLSCSCCSCSCFGRFSKSPAFLRQICAALQIFRPVLRLQFQMKRWINIGTNLTRARAGIRRAMKSTMQNGSGLRVVENAKSHLNLEIF